MKHTLLTLTLLVAFISCKAQNPIVAIDSYEYSENIYYKDINGVFDPFIGTWTWQDGVNSIEIVLIKVEQIYYEIHKRKLYKDRLIGKIKYVENGVEIFNTLNNSNDDYTFINKSVTSINGGFSLRFEDPLLPNKKGHIDFDLINNETQAIFRLRNTEGVRLYNQGETPEDPEFSMPRRVEFILTKQ